jgi:predicted protein tyrosine phosphatase
VASRGRGGVGRNGVWLVDRIAPFRITVCGIEELAGHCEAGVSHVLSILDPEWPVPEAFGRFGEHAKLELRFHDEIEEDVPGKTPPRPDHVARLLAFGRGLTAEPPPAAHLLVHCHAGVSRSTASMALILAQALPGRGGPEIMEAILRIRPQAWPNLRMIEFGDPMLGRGGDLVTAAYQVYRRQLAAGRHSADGMTAARRGREVAAARRVASA